MTDFDHAPELLREMRRVPDAAGGAERSVSAPSFSPGGPAHILHLQRTIGNAAVVQTLREDEAESDPHPITRVIASGGSPIASPVRDQMESAFGHDFSGVRVHNDTSASSSAESVGATAATVGDHIVFRSGAYDPSSSRGQHLLAHELTHVVQQRSGPVDGSPAAGGIRVSDPSDRFETAAEANASHITSQISAQHDQDDRTAQRSVQTMGDHTVQREAHEEDDVQMTARCVRPARGGGRGRGRRLLATSFVSLLLFSRGLPVGVPGVGFITGSGRLGAPQ